MTVDTDTDPVLVDRVSPAYWRVTFDNPPINIFDNRVIASLQQLMTELEADDDVRVVVFDSADPEFFLAHVEVLEPLDLTEQPSGLSPWPDLALRMERAPFITVASVRGRARGVGSEFIQVVDVTFASRERTVLSQPELGFGFVPGGGGLERLTLRTGRARALEIILGADDFGADLAERYGWINRAVDDANLDATVDRFASRVSSFDRAALSAVKATLYRYGPVAAVEDLAASQGVFLDLFMQPASQARMKRLVEAGLQTRTSVELDMADHLA